MNRSTLFITVVGLLVLLTAVLFSLYTSYISTQVYLAQRAPILALPVINLDDLTVTVAALKSSLQDMSNYYEPAELDLIYSSLYPNNFLATLPKTEAARRAVIDTPSLSAIRTYRNALTTTLTEYQKALQTYQKQFESNSNLTTYFLDGKTSTNHLVKELQLLESDIANLIALNTQRAACFWISLQPGCIYDVSAPAQSTDNNSTSLPEPDVLRFVTEVWSDNEPLQTTTIADATCAYGRTTATYAWKHDTSRIHAVPNIKATIVDDLYFYELNSLPETPYYRNLLNQGYLYDFQPTNPYMCLDFASDIAAIALTDYFTRELMTTPLFAGNVTPTLAELAELEHIITAAQDTSNIPIKAYTKALHTLLESHDEATLLEMLGRDNYHRALQYQLIAQTNSVALIPTLGLIDDMMHTSVYILQTSKIKLDFLFLARSYFTATLLFNNRTLITDPVQLYVDDAEPELKNFNLTSYATIKDQYSLAEIRAIMSH